MNKQHIFKNSSTTYYYSSLFFPKDILEQVTTVYAYVRISDNFVDELPQDIKGYKQFIKNSDVLFKGEKIDANTDHYAVLTDFVNLAKAIGIQKDWVDAFHGSMLSDVSNKPIMYRTQKEVDAYIYGSAEVIGLFLAKILDLPEEAHPAAKKQGFAMQYINFIRDIAEDCQLQRQYLPQEKLSQYGLRQLCTPPQTTQEKEIFSAFIRDQISFFKKVQKEAEKGYEYIPYRYRIPIATAAALYDWTADVINANPEIVYKKKVKPTKIQVILMFIKQAIRWI